MLDDLLENNRKWAARVETRHKGFFASLAKQQAPKYLWIGCSDSRVPASEIVGLMPGELFVHRNIANLVVHTDLNCQSVIQYAVESLKVAHIIVCGHYGCGGVEAAMNPSGGTLVDNWLRHLKDIYDRNADELDAIIDPAARRKRFCELHVTAQVQNVANADCVRTAWQNGRSLHIHAWAYDIHDGLLHTLQPPVIGRDTWEQHSPSLSVKVSP